MSTGYFVKNMIRNLYLQYGSTHPDIYNECAATPNGKKIYGESAWRLTR